MPARTKACGLGGQTFRSIRPVAQTGGTHYPAAMENLSYSIAGEVFAMLPDYVRGVVLATAVTNGSSPADLIALLRNLPGNDGVSADILRRSIALRGSIQAQSTHGYIGDCSGGYR